MYFQSLFPAIQHHGNIEKLKIYYSLQAIALEEDIPPHPTSLWSLLLESRTTCNLLATTVVTYYLVHVHVYVHVALYA